MRHTLADVLVARRQWFPPALVSGAAFQRLARMARTVPAPLSRFIGFECRLAPGAERVDLAIGIQRGQFAWVAGPDDEAGQINSHVRRLIEHCLRNEPLSNSVYAIAVECDLPPERDRTRNSRNVPPPGLFIHLDPKAAADPLQLAEAVAMALMPQVTRAVRANLELCLNRLPAGARLLHIGYFPARARDALRLCFQALPEDHIPEYLASIGWSGSFPELERGLSALRGPPGDWSPAPNILHVDLAPNPLPRIGLEYPVNGMLEFGGEARAARFIERLIAHGFCAPEKANEFFAWAGHTFESLPHEAGHRMVLRTVNHVKASFESGRPVELKAYLLFCHRTGAEVLGNGSRRPQRPVASAV